MLSRWSFLLGLCVLLAVSAEASAERRVALVIGNAQYAHAPALRNPVNDAADMAGSLRKVGFEVVYGADLDQRGFARKIEEFARALEGADVALLYYAGHGLQLNDKNYLVSVDARLGSEFLIASETIELDAVIRLMESRTAVNLVFLDACRNNPLAEDLRRNLVAQKRSIPMGRGLAKIEPTGRDTLVAFATAPGQEASDGTTDRNSPFTAALLRHIARPGQEVSVMLKEVAADVRRDTRNAQRPQQVSDMTRTFYFAKLDTVATDSGGSEPARKDPPAPRPAEPSGDDRALDIAYWNAAQAANECEAVRAYMTRFPNGQFIELARLAERRLCTPRVAAASPPQTPASPPQQPQAAAAPPPATPPAPPAAAPAPAPAPMLPAVQPAPAIPAPSADPTPAPKPPTIAAPRIAAAPQAAEPAPGGLPGRPIVQAIQAELHRVGCLADGGDGVWGAPTEGAVQRFNENAGWRFNVRGPSAALLAALRRSDGRVCPLECGDGYEPRGERCVAVAPPAPPAQKRKAAERSRQHERPVSRERRRERAERAGRGRAAAGGEPQRQQQPAARRGGGSTFTSGGRNCRLVPRTTGGVNIGDTHTVCD